MRRIVANDILCFPPALPFLEGVFAGAASIWEKYLEYSHDSSGQNLAIISNQALEGIFRILDLIRNMADNKISWNTPNWEQTTDNHAYRAVTKYERNQVIQVYFTPGINRLGLHWQNFNPYGSTVNTSQFFVDIRLDSSGISPEGMVQLAVDFSIRQANLRTSRQKSKAFCTKPVVELTDLIFGENCHHLRIAKGLDPECQRLIAGTMGLLNVSFLQKTTAEIPRRKK